MNRLILIAGITLFISTPTLAQERNGLDVQKARSEHVSGGAKRIYYTHPLGPLRSARLQAGADCLGHHSRVGFELLCGLEPERLLGDRVSQIPAGREV